ncbi:YEATS domain-containing protein 2-like [Panicum miliaceum]|uniref:YEATS domain-containing protein 2-like n=1 Tax=Panicum miliaceum TaxID=4540 RepID=A0A3L6RIC7_PANMI|nr:YEATS domain-containing protein 2-like [Panicum miliaceum]
MNFHAAGAGVCWPRPPFQPQNTLMAYQLGLPGPQVHSIASNWDHSILLCVLSSADAYPQTPPGASDWYMDMNVSIHISNM